MTRSAPPWRRWSQGAVRPDVKTAQTLAELNLVALRLDVHADELERLIDGGPAERRNVGQNGPREHPTRRRGD